LFPCFSLSSLRVFPLRRTTRAMYMPTSDALRDLTNETLPRARALAEEDGGNCDDCNVDDGPPLLETNVAASRVAASCRCAAGDTSSYSSSPNPTRPVGCRTHLGATP
jgi:hypothetical protein